MCRSFAATEVSRPAFTCRRYHLPGGVLVPLWAEVSVSGAQAQVVEADDSSILLDFSSQHDLVVPVQACIEHTRLDCSHEAVDSALIEFWYPMCRDTAREASDIAAWP